MYQYIWLDNKVAVYLKTYFFNFFPLVLFFIVWCWTQAGWLKKTLSGAFVLHIQFLYLHFAVCSLLNKSKVWDKVILSWNPVLHNSESSKGQIDQHKFAAGHKSLFRCSLEEIMERQLIIRSRASGKFSAIEKALTGHKKSSCGQYDVQACCNLPLIESQTCMSSVLEYYLVAFLICWCEAT